MFKKNTNFDKEMRRSEKSARAFAKRNKRESKAIDNIISGNTSASNYATSNKSGAAGNETLQFFLGILLLGGGLYWLLSSFTVSTHMGGMGGYGYSFFGTRITGGVMMITLLVGIGLIIFLNGKKRFIGYSVTALGLFIIVISLLSSLQFHAKRGSLYMYLLMFGMIAAGTALLIKSTFKKKS